MKDPHLIQTAIAWQVYKYFKIYNKFNFKYLEDSSNKQYQDKSQSINLSQDSSKKNDWNLLQYLFFNFVLIVILIIIDVELIFEIKFFITFLDLNYLVLYYL